MKILLATLILLAPFYSQAQDISYYYDNAGNRTERVLNMLRSAAQSSDATSIDDVVFGQEIKIYPNPTQGELAVEIIDFKEELKGEILLLNASGNTLESKQAVSGKIYFDLSGNPDGIYLMKITLNGETTTWKIIKK